MNNKYSVVITTCENTNDAKEIINALLNEKLIACAQIFPISSYYVWNGEVANDPEISIFLKCKTELIDEIKQEILLKHKYEIPEIICLNISDGSKDYFDWIDDVSK